MSRSIVLILALAVVAAAAARAQEDPALKAFLDDRAYERLAVSAALEADEALFPGCAERKATTRRFMGELERVVFANNRAAPVSGRWLTRVGLERCGEQAFQTIQFEVDDEGELLLQPLLPGETRVLDPRTQLEIARAVYGSDFGVTTGCSERRIVDTRVATQPLGAEGTWIERWVVDACGTQNAHSVTITPTAGGGIEYAAKPAD